MARDFSQLTKEDLLEHWGRLRAELRIRGIVRSSNSPIADFAETLVAKLLAVMGLLERHGEVRAKVVPSGRKGTPQTEVRARVAPGVIA